MDRRRMQGLVDSHMAVFEFRDGLISRENIWLDTAAVGDQLG